MFTGIITNLGKISAIEGKKLKIETYKQLPGRIMIGDSISVNGICLTVTETNKKTFAVEFMPETENRTNLKYLKVGNLVNLELPVTPTSFLSGHILQGHVDSLGRLESIKIEGNSRILKFSFPNNFFKYLVEKGSIAVNGISLTVIQTGRNFFTCGIIPHTWENTMLKNLKKGDFVNLEADILAKYLERLVE